MHPLDPPPPQPTPLRADAALNRRRILAAAGALFAERGVEAVSMDDVARAAGVGKGTVYRRFTDRGGLAVALLEAHGRELQERLIRGPAPVGPGAPPGERLAAFLDALLELVETHTEILVLAETTAPGSRYTSGVYRSYHAHVAMLLRQARPDRDPETLAHAILAPLSAELHRELRHTDHIPLDRIRTALRELARWATQPP